MVVRLFGPLLLLTALAQPVVASSIGIYFDSGGSRDAADVAPFAMVTCFVVVRDVGGELSGYEFSLHASDGLTLINSSMLPASSINVGSAPSNWIVGVGQCLPDQNVRVVAQLTAMLTVDDVNLQISLGPSQPSSVYGEGPAYALCDGLLAAFDEVTPATVNLRPESFGRVKHRYGND